NKYQIKQAVETMFKVKVKSVHTCIFLGKEKKMGGHSGYKSDWKKAIIKLQKGQEISIVDEA
ncbi:MAG: 50S ribosomal protein L23, partial [Endomicrobiaceae bacterium]|nr:50S ribosomal protein L23 [Endomicrobiaceae bacterium]